MSVAEYHNNYKDKSGVYQSNLYDTVSSTYFPLANYMYHKYDGTIFTLDTESPYHLHKDIYDWLINNDECVLVSSTANMTNELKTNVYYFEFAEYKAILKIYPGKSSKGNKRYFGGSLYYTDPNLVINLIEKLQSYIFKVKPGKEDNISLIIQNNNELSTEEYPVKLKNIDVEMNYGDEFVPVFNKIIKRLNTKNDKGIVLLHGIPGTGKTSLIKYIAKKVKKEILFVPPIMAESITTPGFIPFLMDHSNCVLIIEDAEKVLGNREGQFSSIGVSNILNISDGILGDCLNIQIIATYNTERTNIDQALLRKGRLIAEYEFKELPVDRANVLLKHLGKDYVAKKPMTLTDIYNVDEKEYKSTEARRSVGFNSK